MMRVTPDPGKMTMKTMNVRELRQATPHLKQTLAEAGEVLLVSNGEPIARLLPVEPKVTTRPKLPSMKAFRATLPLLERPISADIREERDRR
jgi:antitoxin (DNA-binding transcriptional repressor) of toxin-antitoxin stability system